MTLYHATKKNNVFPIMREGLKAGTDGAVYFSDTPENALKFMVVGNTEREEYAVIPVEFETDDIEESHDHDESFFKCKAWAYNGDIPKERIPMLKDIPLFEVRFEEKQ